MNADIGFGWIVFVGFLFWLLQVLRAGATGGSGRRPVPPASHPPRPDATQREGEQLEELLRHLEAPVDREAEAEAIERRRDAAVAARSQALTDADHAVFEARIDAERTAATANAPARNLTPRRLREAFVWSEILGLPVALRE
jgi:hypothetical protein